MFSVAGRSKSNEKRFPINVSVLTQKYGSQIRRPLRGLEPWSKTLLKCTPSAIFCFSARSERCEIDTLARVCGAHGYNQRCVNLTSRAGKLTTVTEKLTTHNGGEIWKIAWLCLTDLKKKKRKKKEKLFLFITIFILYIFNDRFLSRKKKVIFFTT